MRDIDNDGQREPFPETFDGTPRSATGDDGSEEQSADSPADTIRFWPQSDLLSYRWLAAVFVLSNMTDYSFIEIDLLILSAVTM
jgi:hypothetical protein